MSAQTDMDVVSSKNLSLCAWGVWLLNAAPYSKLGDSKNCPQGLCLSINIPQN